MARALLLCLLLAAPAWAEPDAGLGEPGDAGTVLAEATLVAPEPAESDDDPDDLDAEADVQASIDGALADAGILYTSDLTDEELTRRWVEDPASLGSISVGMTEAGRLVNGVPVPPGAAWKVVDPTKACGTQETIDFVVAAATAVREQFPGAVPLRINHLGKKNGG